MSINGISTGYYQTGYTDNKTAKATGTSFSNQLNNIAGKGHTVYMKTDDMLYSGGNGTGLSFYLKYAENSTEDDPIVIAKGIDENGEEFEQTIHINKINPKCATYDTEKAQKAGVNSDFAGKIAEAEQANATGAAATAHGFDEESGDVAVFSTLYTDSASKYTVYKTQDFDPENPVYKVKIWDAAGNVTERMLDVSKVDPKNCDTFEMNVYAAHLKESGKGDFKETVLKAAIARAASHLEQKSSASWDYLTKINWVDTVKGIMQSAYGYGDLKRYMEWKKFLSFLE